MSTQSHSDGSPVIECNAPDCEEHGPRLHFHHGKYCSDECTTRAEGRAAVGDIRFDHTICGTCFRELKEVEEPKPSFEFCERGHGWSPDGEDGQTLEFYDQTEARESACGFQYKTEHATFGEKQRGDRVVTGTVCASCGNTSHFHHDTDLADAEDVERLVARLEDDEDVEFDPNELHRAWIETKDLDLAVGRALTDD